MSDPASSIDPIYAETFASQLGKADRRRFSIIQAAIEEIARHGLTTAIYEHVAKRLAIRRTLVKYYFDRREDLLLAVERYIAANAQRITVEQLRECRSADEQVRGFARGALLWARDFPEQARVHLLFQYHASIDPECNELAAEFRRAGAARVAAILCGGRKPTKAQEELARMLQAAVSGRVFEMTSAGVARLPRDFIEATVKLCAELCRSGARARP